MDRTFALLVGIISFAILASAFRIQPEFVLVAVGYSVPGLLCLVIVMALWRRRVDLALRALGGDLLTMLPGPGVAEICLAERTCRFVPMAQTKVPSTAYDIHEAVQGYQFPIPFKWTEVLERHTWLMNSKWRKARVMVGWRSDELVLYLVTNSEQFMPPYASIPIPFSPDAR